MFAPVIGAAYTMTTKREAHLSEQTKTQNTEKGMYVGLKQPRRDSERYVTPARAAAKETTPQPDPEASDWIKMLGRRGFTGLVLPWVGCLPTIPGLTRPLHLELLFDEGDV